MTIDGGEEKKSGTAVAANFTTGINMGIFAHLKANGAAPYSPASMKLYSLKLWLTDANGVCRLQRDYRPCVKDSKAGLYDTISGVIFYPTNATPLTASGTQLPIALWRNHTGDGSFDNPENWGGVANAATNIVYVRCDNAITVAGDHAFDKLAIEGFGAIRFSGAGTISIGESLTSYADLTVGNMVLNGTCATNLTVAGSISGHGTVQSLAFGEGATFKPDGTGYLTITDSLSGTVTVDAGDLLLENRRIPLFKTGTSAALPSAESIQFVGGKQPKGWTLNSAHEGYGYDICKKGFMIFIM